jgi:hypothetical protein
MNRLTRVFALILSLFVSMFTLCACQKTASGTALVPENRNSSSTGFIVFNADYKMNYEIPVYKDSVNNARFNFYRLDGDSFTLLDSHASPVVSYSSLYIDSGDSDSVINLKLDSDSFSMSDSAGYTGLTKGLSFVNTNTDISPDKEIILAFEIFGSDDIVNYGILGVPTSLSLEEFAGSMSTYDFNYVYAVTVSFDKT